MLLRSLRVSSLAAFTGAVLNYAAFYLAGTALYTETIAEWIMARTPNTWSVAILAALGAWAKPWAVTGGLAALGFACGVLAFAALRRPLLLAVLAPAVALAYAWCFEFASVAGNLVFWLPALAVLFFATRRIPVAAPTPARREFLVSAVMSAGTVGVAVESYLREQALAARAVEPVPLFSITRLPKDRLEFGAGLVRKPITPVGQFYVMSKNTVDPALDPREWRLHLSVDGIVFRTVRYQELLSLPRSQRFQTLRCVSNTLKSDLMGTAEWSGVHLHQLVDRASLPSGLVECAVLGVDGHGDSVPIDYAFSDEFLLALGMNGKTLNRQHGFPLRLLVPRYYGFKHVKWIGEIRFTRQPYFGTWPKMGYTKEPLIHTMSYFDRVRREGDRLRVGGVAFAGTRGIRQVQVRAGGGSWQDVTIEAPLSGYTLTRWSGELAAPAGSGILEARAMDGSGRWQSDSETPLFPNGVQGPTVRKMPS